MNLHNFSICPMIMKFCGECSGTLGILGKILFLLFDTFQYDFLIMLESALLAYEFCLGIFYGKFDSNFYSSLLVVYRVPCNFRRIF
jgi:hypothetical protein